MSMNVKSPPTGKVNGERAGRDVIRTRFCGENHDNGILNVARPSEQSVRKCRGVPDSDRLYELVAIQLGLQMRRNLLLYPADQLRNTVCDKG